MYTPLRIHESLRSMQFDRQRAKSQLLMSALTRRRAENIAATINAQCKLIGVASRLSLNDPLERNAKTHKRENVFPIRITRAFAETER